MIVAQDRETQYTDKEEMLSARQNTVGRMVRTIPALILVGSIFCGPRPDLYATVTDQATPPVRNPTTGSVSIFLREGRIDYRLQLRGFRSVDSAFLHLGSVGDQGPAIARLYPPAGQEDAGPFAQNIILNATLTAENLLGPLEGAPLDSLVDLMKQGRTYVSMILGGQLGGEILGPVN